ncbi:hypothetical protein pb186bvf_003055 [Paramecium bursaria]
MTEEEITPKEQPVIKQEPPERLTKKMMKTCDPKSIHRKFLKDFKFKLDNTTMSILKINLRADSPKTAQALESLELHFDDTQQEQFIILHRPRENFILKGESNEQTDKRYIIHLYQIAEQKKRVIFERNKFKREEQINKSRMIKDNESSKSIQITEYSPYKSPTEMIESWIENQTNKVSQFQKKVDEIKKKQEEDIIKDEIDQEKYLEQNAVKLAKKLKKRQDQLKKRAEIAKEHNSKSVEVQERMKKQYEIDLKASIHRKNIKEKKIDDVTKKLEDIKLTIREEQEEKQRIYEEKLQKAQQRKIELQEIRIQSQDIHTERGLSKKSSIMKSQKLPRIHKANSEPQHEEIEHVIKIFKKNKNNQSVASNDESAQLKLEEIKQRHLQKLKEVENRSLMVQSRLEKKDSYLIELIDKQKIEIEEKFDRKRNLINKNEERFYKIRQQYSEKCDRQLEREFKKYRSNQNLIKNRDIVIEKLKQQRFRSFQKSG